MMAAATWDYLRLSGCCIHLVSRVHFVLARLFLRSVHALCNWCVLFVVLSCSFWLVCDRVSVYFVALQCPFLSALGQFSFILTLL